ncbi:TetR/AcrR family transcriptional regulator [Kribbella sancticallisti]|uniref:TetR/AcrR family transcriptional regulator n=1 Tax=Kribbella sancticallisti TaxID=460087 RepID=UPI0031D40AAE
MRSKNGAGGRVSFIQAARRRQIIGAAIETVTAVGYGQSSLARIAEQAEISKSVISYHFANKDELLEQVVAQVMDDWAAFMRPFLEAESTATGRLSAYIRSRLAYMRDNQTRLVAVAEIIVNHRGPDGRPVFAERDAAPVAELVELLRSGQQAGEFRGFDPVVLAMTITQGIDGALTYWADHPGTDLTAYGEELVTLFGLATQQPRSIS